MIAGAAGVESGQGALGPAHGSNSASGPRPSILALENDPCLSLLEIFRPTFEEMGNEFLTTNDEHKALQILLTQPVNLFILNLAGRLRLLQLVKSEPALCQTPVLVVSGFRKLAAIDMLKRAGLVLYRDLDGYLEKPYTPEDLFSFVGAILARRAKVSN